jgi:HK97 family phage major capsid protein
MKHLRPGSTPQVDRIHALNDDLDQLKKGIWELREGEAKGEANSELIAEALERDYAAKEAELRRESVALAGGGASGAVLAKGQSMRDSVGDTGPDVTLGQIIKGRGFGRWEGISQDAKALILSDGAGGAIPGAVTSGIIDLARQESVLFQAGALAMPLAAPTARVARLTAAPTAQWKPESAERELDDQAFVFDAADLAVSTAWLYATISVEASEDVLDLDQAIMNHFARQLALTFDEAGIAGTGIDQPVGLANMGTIEDRVLELNAVGDIAGYTPFVQAVGAVKAAHYEPSSVILTPDLWTTLACLTDTTDQPLRAPAAYAALNEYVSDFLLEAGDESPGESSGSTAIVGDLSAMTFGVKTSAQIEISRLGAGFAKGSIAVRGYIRFGWYLTRPEAICIMRGLTVADES